jgi:hypothetical protein
MLSSGPAASGAIAASTPALPPRPWRARFADLHNRAYPTATGTFRERLHNRETGALHQGTA